MAKTDLPFNIDRRRLLTSAAAVTATGIVPGFEGADTAAAPDFFQSSPLTLEAEPPNFCAGTARRLLEIARRNELRQEACRFCRLQKSYAGSNGRKNWRSSSGSRRLVAGRCGRRFSGLAG
jgi:hypothetical protein